MSISSVAHKYIFGAKSDIKSNLLYLDDGVYVFVAGASVIIYNAEQRTHRFTAASDKAEAITCISLSNDRRFLAIAERTLGSSSGAKPVIHIHEVVTLRRRRTLQCAAEVTGREFVALSFSADGKYIASCTDGPEFVLSYWAWEKGKNLGSLLVFDETTQGKPRAAGGLVMNFDGHTSVRTAAAPDPGIGKGFFEKPLSAYVPAAGSQKRPLAPPADKWSLALRANPHPTSLQDHTTQGNSLGRGITAQHHALETVRDQTHIHQVAINPFDSSQICVVGTGIFVCAKYSDALLSIDRSSGGTLVPDFRCCAYTSIDRLILGSGTGRIFVIELGDARSSKSSISWTEPKLASVESIIPLSNALVVAGHGPYVVFYDPVVPGESPELHHLAEAPGRTAHTKFRNFAETGGREMGDFDDAGGDDDRDRNVDVEDYVSYYGNPPPYRVSQRVLVCRNGGTSVSASAEARSDKEEGPPVWVMSATAAPTEDVIAVFLKDCRMYYYRLEKEKANEAAKDTSCTAGKKSDVQPHFTPLSPAFHHGSITGMDTCIRKPMIVTCATDRSIRIWNYLDCTCDLVKYFPEEASSVALHPSGLYVLAGFPDKLRLVNVLTDDFRVTKEFPIRSCRECRFATGGHLFAAVYGNTIQLYSTWTFDNVGILKGHNGKVRSLCWSEDDSKIVSAGSDGAVYIWNVKALKRDGENVLKTCSYTCAVFENVNGLVYAVGNDRTLKEINESQIVKEVETNSVLTQVVMSRSGKMMFVGTATGTVRAVKYPFSSDPDGYQEHMAHVGAVTRMRVSFDDQFLFSCAEDGSLIVYRISDRETRVVQKEGITYADEVLITKTDIEEKTSLMVELRSRLDELKMENEYQLRLKDMNFSEKAKELNEKFMQEIEALKVVTTMLRAEKEKVESKHEQELTSFKEAQMVGLQEVESKCNQTLMAEYEKFQAAEEFMIKLQDNWQKQMREAEIKKNMSLESLTTEYETKLKSKAQECLRLQDEMRQQLREFQEMQRQTSEDVDTELAALKEQYEKRLKTEREHGLRLKGENGIMRKKFNTLHKDIEDNNGEILRMLEQEKKLMAVIKNLEKDIAALKKEISERDESILEKEKRVYDMKKKNQELEKFKFVLDYKIKSLKREIEPREKEIAQHTANIRGTSDELSRCSKQQSALEVTIADLNASLAAKKAEAARTHSKIRSTQRYIDKFKTELTDIMGYIQEPAVLQKSIENLHRSYCGEESVAKIGAMHPEIKSEYIRQQDYLTKAIVMLRAQITKNISTFDTDNVHAMVENEMLIKEVATLRNARRRNAVTDSSPGDARPTDILPAVHEAKLPFINNDAHNVDSTHNRRDSRPFLPAVMT